MSAAEAVAGTPVTVSPKAALGPRASPSPVVGVGRAAVVAATGLAVGGGLALGGSRDVVHRAGGALVLAVCLGAGMVACPGPVRRLLVVAGGVIVCAMTSLVTGARYSLVPFVMTAGGLAAAWPDETGRAWLARLGIRLGERRLLAVAGGVASGLGASVVLVAWLGRAGGTLVTGLGDAPFAVLAVAVVAFALLNASAEELVWRVALPAVLGSVVRPAALVSILASVSFGLAHLRGIPWGWSGVLLAGAYGLVLDRGTRRSRGLLFALSSHVTVDVVIGAWLLSR